MTIKITNPDTNEEMEVYTAAEMKEQQDKIAELTAAKNKAGEDISQMSKKFEKVDEFEKKVAGLETTLAEKTKSERESAKNAALNKWHGGKEDLKKQLEESYDKLNMPENTAEEIAARSELAARIAGIQTDPRNPLYAGSGMSGEAPRSRPVAEGAKEKAEEFYKSDRGQAALKAMGLDKPAAPATK